MEMCTGCTVNCFNQPRQVSIHRLVLLAPKDADKHSPLQVREATAFMSKQRSQTLSKAELQGWDCECPLYEGDAYSRTY